MPSSPRLSIAALVHSTHNCFMDNGLSNQKEMVLAQDRTKGARAHFGDCILDTKAGVLLRGGVEVHIQPLAFQLLTHLCSRPGHLFSRQSLQDLLWPDTFVGDEALTQMIRRVRKAIEGPEKSPKWLITVPRRGYRFADAVEWIQNSEPIEQAADFVKTDSSEEKQPSINSAKAITSRSLPHLTGSFVGRENSLQELTSLFEEGAALITLMGPGGLGKTRLVVHFATHCLPELPVSFVDLSSVHNLDSLVMSLTSALELQVSGGASAELNLEMIGRALELGTPRVVILDNFETVIDFACPVVNAWLRLSPSTRFLVTSRERLNLAAELVSTLKPLDSDAAQLLFRQRAKAVGALLNDTQDEVVALERLTNQLDNSPLAIELAAGRTVSMGIEQIVSRLDQRFRLLRSRRQDLPIRHQSLQTVIEESLSRLQVDQQILLACCARLPGPVSLETLEGLVSCELDDKDAWIPDLLQDLIDRSLIWSRPQAGSAPIFGMQENIRAYLRLNPHPESDEWKAQLESLILSRLSVLLLEPTYSLEVLTLVEAGSQLAEPRPLWLGRFALIVCPWYSQHAVESKASSLFSKAIDLGASIPPGMMTCLLIERGNLYPEGGSARFQDQEKAAAIAAEHDLETLAMEVVLRRCSDLTSMGRFKEVLDKLPSPEKVVLQPLYLQAEAEAVYLLSMANLGGFESSRAAHGYNPYGAWRMRSQVLSMTEFCSASQSRAFVPQCEYRPTMDFLSHMWARAFEVVANVLMMHGEIEEASQHHQNVMDLYTRLGWKRAHGFLLCNISVALMGDPASLPRVLECLEQAGVLFESLGMVAGVIKVCDYRSFTCFLQGGDSSLGWRDAKAALALADEIKGKAQAVALYKNMNLLCWMDGNQQQALNYCEQALLIAREEKQVQRIWELELYSSSHKCVLGDLEGAEQLYAEVAAREQGNAFQFYKELESFTHIQLTLAQAFRAGKNTEDIKKKRDVLRAKSILYVRRLYDVQKQALG